jgi:Flp pilus assembly protein TadD
MRSKRFMMLTGGFLVSGLMVLSNAGCEGGAGFSTGASQEVMENDTDPKIPPKTHYAAGRLLERRGDFEGAIQQYRRAIALSADYVDALNRLGVTLDRLGRFDEADDAFTEAIILRPGEAYLRNNMAFSYMLQRRWKDAEAELRNALVLDPNFDRARVNLALVLARQQRFEDALTAFSLALSQADAYYNMGLIYREQGLFDEAKEAFNKSLETDPSMEAAREQLQTIEQQLAAIDARQQQIALKDQPRIAEAEVRPTPRADAATSELDEPAIDEDCDDETRDVVKTADDAMPPRTLNDPIKEWESAVGNADDVTATPAWMTRPAPATHTEPDEPERFAPLTTLLLNETVHEIARETVREVFDTGSDLASAQASPDAMQDSTPINPVDPAADRIVNEPSVSSDDVPAAHIPATRVGAAPVAAAPVTAAPVTVTHVASPSSMKSPSGNVLDRIAAVDGPAAGRATLFGHAAVRDDNGERLADPVRRVSEQRHAALTRFRGTDVTPFAPHARGAFVGPNDRLPNQPMVRIAGSCQCTDRWQDHLLPKE